MDVVSDGTRRGKLGGFQEQVLVLVKKKIQGRMGGFSKFGCGVSRKGGGCVVSRKGCGVSRKRGGCSDTGEVV